MLRYVRLLTLNIRLISLQVHSDDQVTIVCVPTIRAYSRNGTERSIMQAVLGTNLVGNELLHPASKDVRFFSGTRPTASKSNDPYALT